MVQGHLLFSVETTDSARRSRSSAYGTDTSMRLNSSCNKNYPAGTVALPQRKKPEQEEVKPPVARIN
jgi:hypothetical protein